MYRQLRSGQVVRMSDGAFIPSDPRNRDAQEYLDWVEAGNAPQQEPGESIAEIRTRARQDIDALVQAARDELTDGAGSKGVVYLLKEAEAREQQSGAPGPFPMLQATVGIDGVDVTAVASVVLAKAAQFRAVVASLETLRLTAKKAASEAETEQQVAAVVDGVRAQLATFF